MRRLISSLMLAAMLSVSVNAQNSALTKEQVLSMSIDELSDLSLEDLMYAVELLELKSVDELFALLMNKNVSSASKEEEDSFESPLSSSVITKEEMRIFGCSNVEEALRLLPGVIVREKTNGVYDIHLRGLDNVPDGNMLLYTENVNTLLMIDGRPIYNYIQGATMWETIPVSIEDINRIEVVRGPSSALYGAGAVTGVINIITENPSTTNAVASGQMQMGTHNTYVGDLALRKTFNDKLAAQVSVNMQSRDRATSDIYLIPGQGLVNIKDPSKDYSEGGYVSPWELATDIKKKNGDVLYDVTEVSAPIKDMFKDSHIARRNMGLNAGLSYKLADDININLNAGYQQSQAMTTPVGDDYFSLNMRESKQGYIDMRADIKGIAFQVNYADGPQNFMIGAPSFKVRNQMFTTNLEYNWKLTHNLSIRPGLNFRHSLVDDYDYNDYYGVNTFGENVKLKSFLNGESNIKSFAGSIRLDYKPTDKLRLIGAIRADKMNIPDKVQASWQIATTYSPSDNHNLRLAVARGTRSAILVNTSSNYEMMRTGLTMPNRARFRGNKDASVMYADNIELGYRWRPGDGLLIDIEAFYTASKDYGALMAVESELNVTADRMKEIISFANDLMKKMKEEGLTDEQVQPQMQGMSMSKMETVVTIQYNNLPYTVKQAGLSMAIDWIVSEKFIVKAHANFQQTKIDNYFLYSQANDIQQTLSKSIMGYVGAIRDISGTLAAKPESFAMFQNMAKALPLDQYYQGLQQATANGKADEYLASLKTPETVGAYYALKYNMVYDPATNSFSAGTSRDTGEKEMLDGHKHKATPSLYGMLGFIYRPTKPVSIAANVFMYGKQTTTTTYGTEEIKPKCVVNLKAGYKPMDQIEVFFNAHNLFDNSSREFVYMDHGRGIYSAGVNFNF